MGSSRRWLLNQDTHVSVASSKESLVLQRARQWSNSALWSPLIASASGAYESAPICSPPHTKCRVRMAALAMRDFSAMI
jgi:hypothetical protein